LARATARRGRKIVFADGRGIFVTALRRGFPAGLSAWLAAVLAAAGLTTAAGPAATASAAGPPAVNLRILLIGEGSADPTTAAWQALADQ